MIIYCLKSILCLGILWGFYQLFLENERIHHFKRGYLLFCALIALTLPLLTLTYEKEVFIEPNIHASTLSLENPSAPMDEEPLTPPIIHPKTEVQIHSTDVFIYLLLIVYSIGVLLFGYRFLRNLYQMGLQIREHDKLSDDSFTFVFLKQPTVPFTFLHYIFVSKTAFNNNTIPNEVLVHEKAHVLQKHTWDILFIELLQIVFWFNPFFIFLKKSIRLNHEFLADQGVLNQKFTLSQYLPILVNYSSGSNQTTLSSSLNYSLTKKRLQMMTTHFSPKKVALKMSALLLTLLACMFLFNNQIIAKEVITKLPQAVAKTIAVAEKEDPKTIPVLEKITRVENATFQKVHAAQIVKDSVSKRRFGRYKKWVQKVRNDINNGRISSLQDELDSMKALYNRMSLEQKNRVASFESITTLITQSFVPAKPQISSPEIISSLRTTASDSIAMVSTDVQESISFSENELKAEEKEEIKIQKEKATSAKLSLRNDLQSKYELSNALVIERYLDTLLYASMRAEYAKKQIRKVEKKEKAAAKEKSKKINQETKEIYHTARVSMLKTLDNKTTYFYKKESISKNQVLEMLRDKGNDLDIQLKPVNKLVQVWVKD